MYKLSLFFVQFCKSDLSSSRIRTIEQTGDNRNKMDSSLLFRRFAVRETMFPSLRRWLWLKAHLLYAFYKGHYIGVMAAYMCIFLGQVISA